MPAGEALGRFAISPKPNLTAAGTEPGTKVNSPPTPAAANVTGAAGSAAGAATNAAGALSNAAGATANVTGIATNPAGVLNGTNPAAATANANPGSSKEISSKDPATKDKGAGSAGAGIDKAKITVVGGASGSGSGMGKSAFDGITIVGGVADAGASVTTASPPRPRRPLQTAYDVTVVATENSGGGLPYFGVFSQKQVYTVYLDMRETETENTPSWTLEFAVQEQRSADAGTKTAAQKQQGLVLPFPAVKEKPVIPADLARRYVGKMVIVYGIINVEGKLEQLSIKESPDPLLNSPILEALKKWVFRAARQDGEPVGAIMLLGIPVWIY